MRTYFRTSRRTGVSFGWFGTLVIAVLCMAVLGLPIYVAELLFSTWWSAAITIVVLVLLALAWESQREQRNAARDREATKR